MERPTSEKVALLERVLNRIRDNARDASGRARFARSAPEPKKGASVAQPSAPPPTLALSADLLPDATSLAAAEAVSPPPPPVVAAPSPLALADAAVLVDVPGAPPLDDVPTPPSVEAIPPSGQTRVVSVEDIEALRAGQENAAPLGGPRATQGYGQPDDLHVDVAFDESQAEARVPSAPPPAAPSPSPATPPSAPPSASPERNDITGVRPIAPAAAPARMPSGSFGGPPFEVDLASTIELPASELASAVHSSTDEEAPAPASSPRLRSNQLGDDDTYPAVSPSSLPPEFNPALAEPERGVPVESQVGMRAPSVAPPASEEPATTPPPPPVASEMAPPPLRRSDLPRPLPPSYHPEAEPAAASAEPTGSRMVVAPPPPAAPTPEPRPAPAPLDTIALEADAFARSNVQGSAANFVSAVRGAAPRTFGDLLDASLALGADL
ncbi:MAG: hypothetical protein MUF34_11770 [Polyangiaceae bacterium]|jgi:hypothetical protein|nr:hypothetical protein [Polyangiaceae bacterium]